jgi:hypothetical protein
MQSSSFDSMGMKPSLFTDSEGEFNFYRQTDRQTDR